MMMLAGRRFVCLCCAFVRSVEDAMLLLLLLLEGWGCADTGSGWLAGGGWLTKRKNNVPRAREKNAIARF